MNSSLFSAIIFILAESKSFRSSQLSRSHGTLVASVPRNDKKPHKFKESSYKMEQKDGEKENGNFKITAETILFFDMDGTLVDTNFANFLSYKEAIKSVTNSDHYLNYNPEERFNRSNLKVVIPSLSVTECDRIIQRKEECYEEFLHETKLNQVIVEILFKYSKTNKTILVTNCRKERALKTLNYFGLTDKFSNIFFRKFSDNNIKTNKFQNAISELGVPSNLIVAFENEEIEIADAKQAGIEIINPIII